MSDSVRQLCRQLFLPPAEALAWLLRQQFEKPPAVLADASGRPGRQGSRVKILLDPLLWSLAGEEGKALGLSRAGVMRLALVAFLTGRTIRLAPEHRQLLGEAVVALNRVGSNLNGLLRDERTAAARGELPDLELHRYREVLEELEGARRRLASVLAPYEHAGA